jgi:hypothetical protein
MDKKVHKTIKNEKNDTADLRLWLAVCLITNWSYTTLLFHFAFHEHQLTQGSILLLLL